MSYKKWTDEEEGVLLNIYMQFGAKVAVKQHADNTGRSKAAVLKKLNRLVEEMKNAENKKVTNVVVGKPVKDETKPGGNCGDKHEEPKKMSFFKRLFSCFKKTKKADM